MLRKRIIPRILVKEQAGRLIAVVSKEFKRFYSVGNPLSQVKIMDSNKADEISIIQIGESLDRDSSKFLDFLELAVKSSMTPISAGGGVRTHEKMRLFMKAGIEKIILPVNTNLKNLKIAEEMAFRHGSQALQVSLDYRLINSGYQLKSSSKNLNIDEIVALLSRYLEAGAGEISLCNIERDGSKSGLDLSLFKILDSVISVPVTLGGGAGKIEDFVEGYVSGADGIISGTYLARLDHSLLQVRSKIAIQDINVRQI